MASLEDSAFDRQHVRSARKRLDEETYRTVVLRSPPDLTEDEVDRRLEVEACRLGVQNESPPVDRLMTSVSATTVASDNQKPGSPLSQSTDLTSCSSSEKQNAYKSCGIYLRSSSPTRSINSSLHLFPEKKASGFRNGFRRMSVFKRSKSAVSSVSTAPTNVGNGARDASPIERRSKQGSLESSMSNTSRKSSWSPAIPPGTISTTQDVPSDDKEAIRRTTQCIELQELQSRQRDERDRFWRHQRKCLSDMRTDHEKSKKQKIDAQAAHIQEAMTKSEESIADLESRHLKAEMRLISDLDAEKRARVLRLRHMEAYCHSQSPSQTPPCTPPPTSSDSSSLDSHSRSSQRHGSIDANTNTNPESSPFARKVTDKDFNNLAQQYRECDTMEALHSSKVEVLRGRQEKQYADHLAKKDRELEELKARHKREIETQSSDARADEEALKLLLADKRFRLQRRWRLESKIEKTRQEKIMGLPFAMPPDISWDTSAAETLGP